MYGGQLRKEQARCALPKLAGGWLAGVGLPHSSTVLKEEKFDFFFFFGHGQKFKNEYMERKGPGRF